MAKFLKFSFTIINLSSIKQIDIQPDKYDVYLNDNEIKGSYNLMRVGDLFSKSSKIVISKMTHPSDYIKMKDWINQIE
jgi:hypothetical protein